MHHSSHLLPLPPKGCKAQLYFHHPITFILPKEPSTSDHRLKSQQQSVEAAQLSSGVRMHENYTGTNQATGVVVDILVCVEESKEGNSMNMAWELGIAHLDLAYALEFPEGSMISLPLLESAKSQLIGEVFVRAFATAALSEICRGGEGTGRLEIESSVSSKLGLAKLSTTAGQQRDITDEQITKEGITSMQHNTGQQYRSRVVGAASLEPEVGKPQSVVSRGAPEDAPAHVTNLNWKPLVDHGEKVRGQFKILFHCKLKFSSVNSKTHLLFDKL